MKKIVSILLICVLCFTFSCSVMAVSTQTETLIEDEVLNASSSDTTIDIETELIENTNTSSTITPMAQATDIINGGIYNIRNYSSGKYINVHYGIDANATNVYQWSKDGSTEQKFKVVYNSSTDSYKIYAMCSSNGTNRVLDVVRNGAALAAGQNVDIWTPVDATAQEMKIIPVGDGYYKISMRANTNLCLTAYGSGNGTGSGTSFDSTGNIYIGLDYNFSAQKWAFELVGTTVAQPTGELESVNSSSIEGWAWRSDIPNTAISVYIDVKDANNVSKFTSYVTASSYRADLYSSGFGNGYHGFSCSIDWNSLPAGDYYVYAYGISSTNQLVNLSNSPLSYANIKENQIVNNDGSETLTWTFLDEGLPSIASFTVDYNTYIKWNEYNVRTVTEIQSFGKTEANSFSYYGTPKIEIGVTTIGSTTINMQPYSNVLVDPNWSWGAEIGYPNLTIGNTSTCSSLIVCTMSDAINPAKTINNEFDF